MDANNVITVTNDLASLENDMNNWLNLTYDQRRNADIICFDKYGCNNIELYNSIKASIIKNESLDKKYINEDFHVIEDPHFSDLSIEVLFYKIQTANFIQKNDPNIVIINDFASDSEPDYDLNELQNKYVKYIGLPSNYKSISNDYSIEIWGRAVSEMYTYMKQKLLKLADDYEKDYLNTSVEDKALRHFESCMMESVARKNYLEYCIYKIDCMIPKETLYESSVLRWLNENIEYDNKYSYKNLLPAVTPFFTYNEYCDLVEDASDKTSAYSYAFVEDTKKYFDTITKLQESGNKDGLLQLGWNPEVEFNPITIKYAREKQINWFQENKQCEIIDMSDYHTSLTDEQLLEADTGILKPIYIVLSYTGTTFGKVINKFEHSTMSHSGLSLDSFLNKIYSFNFQTKKKINGFSEESLDDYNDKNKDAKLLVLCFFVTDKVKEKIESVIKFYKDSITKTRYGFDNLFNIVINKAVDTKESLSMVCSQFVDNVLKLCNIDITNKSSNLVAPGDFEKINNPKVFVVFEGRKKNYDHREIEKKTKALMKNRDYYQLDILAPKAALESVRSFDIEGFNIDCSDQNIHQVLREIRKYITPSSVIILNEKHIPFGFNNKGDLYVDLPKDLQNEYNEAHKLLYMYDQNNINGIKHELARLFYLNGIIEKRLKKLKKEDKQYKELIDLRARILNDYTTFFKVIKEVEPDFDFSEYMKNSEYYNKTINIDGVTLKYSGMYIKKAIKDLLKK